MKWRKTEAQDLGLSANRVAVRASVTSRFPPVCSGVVLTGGVNSPSLKHPPDVSSYHPVPVAKPSKRCFQ